MDSGSTLSEHFRDDLEKVRGQTCELGETLELGARMRLSAGIVAPPGLERARHARGDERVHGVELADHVCDEAIAAAILGVESQMIGGKRTDQCAHAVGILDV